MRTFLLAFVLAAAIVACSSTYVPDAEWINYKNTFLKNYLTATAESNARYYYAVNMGKIDTHNARFAKGLETYQLGPNQYTDLRFLEFAALFPPTTEIVSNADPFTLPTVAPQASFSYPGLGFESVVQDQGLVCNSGWAYSAAAAVQIYQASITGTLNSPTLSAQNFIDCAGAARACVNQVSQVAFDYLTQFLQTLYPTTTYLNRPLVGQGMCIQPTNPLNGQTLQSYSTLTNGNDVALRSVVNYVAPVVIKFNPGSFEFMHYKSGIFTQPAPTQTAAHYLTVVGFDTDATTARPFWLVQNSFGTTWGEAGYIRIERNTAKPITSSAIFPSA